MTIQENVSLAPFTTFRVGGPARYFCRAVSVLELKEALAFAGERELPVFIMGGGSNILVADNGFHGLVIKNELLGIAYEEDEETVRVVAGAGEDWDNLVVETVSRGLWGMENLSGIPGTVGATPIQNIGAYGVEAKDIIEWVEVYEPQTDTLVMLSSAACGFSYRHSIFKEAGHASRIVTRVCYRLHKKGSPNLSYKDLTAYFGERDETPALAEVRDAVLAIRAGKFPDLATVGTAGSFFKNPIIREERYRTLTEAHHGLPGFPTDAGIKVPLAWILDKVCGLKGTYRGKVGAFDRQPLVIVANDGATANDVKVFADDVARIVQEKTGIVIEPEVTLFGF